MKIRALLLPFLSSLVAASAVAEPVYWISRNEGTISRQRLDGDVEVILSGLNSPSGLAIDIDAGHLYWTDFGDDAIRRADLDGTNVITLVTNGVFTPDGIALDIDGGKMYWVDWAVDKIFRANMDGTDVEEIVTTGLDSVSAIDVDPIGGKIYWTENYFPLKGLYRANLDGSSVELVVPASMNAKGVAIDHRLRIIYWGERETIYSRPLDGGATTTVLTDTDFIQKIAVRGDRIYWSAFDDHVRSAKSDGTDITPIVGTLDPQGIAAPVRSVSRYRAIYWADHEEGGIWRSNPDGSRPHRERFQAFPGHVQVDVYDGRVFWSHSGSISFADIPGPGSPPTTLASPGNDAPFFFANWISGAIPPTVYYGNMSAQTIETVTLDGVTDVLIANAGQVTAIELAVPEGKIYWSTFQGEIYRANFFDGSNVELVVTGAFYIWDLALDRQNLEIYWCEDNGAIRKSDYHGNNVQALTLLDGWAEGIDIRGQYLYWTNAGPGEEGIYRSRLDLFQIEQISASIGEPWGMSTPWRLPLEDQAIYWTDYGTDRIMRSNFDGSATTIIADAGLDFPSDVEVDLLGGYVYWTDFGTNKIQRTDIAGGGAVEDLVTTGLVNPDGIDLDLVAKKIYWSDRGTGKIQRSNFDGTGVEDVVSSGLLSHSGLALDVSAGFMYWVEQGGVTQDGIYRATLAGSGVTQIIQSFSNPNDLTLDLVNGHIYWTEAGKVRRADLDGSDETDIVTGLGIPRGIGVDTVYEYVYWTDSSTDLVQRVKFDGSCLETIMYGETPYGLSIPDQNDVVSVGESVTPIARNVLAAPNPFHVTTNIRFEAATTGVAELNIFDVSGRRLRSLVTEPLRGGTQAITWDGRDARGRAVPSGVYFYRLEMGDAVEVGRVTRVE